MKNSMQALMEICRAVAQETDLERLLNQILDTAMDITCCRAGTLYFREGESLSFRLVRNLDLPDFERDGAAMPPVPMSSGHHLCSLAAAGKKTISIPDAYCCREYDLSGPMAYDKRTGYHTTSVLVCPILGESGECLAVLQLINALDEAGQVRDFSDTVSLVEALACNISSALQNVRFQSEVERLTGGQKTAGSPIYAEVQAHIEKNYYGVLSQQELRKAAERENMDQQILDSKENRMRRDAAYAYASVDLDDLHENVREYVQGRKRLPGYDLLWRYLEEAGLTPAQLCKRLGLSRGTMSQICSGTRTLTKKYIFPIAFALNLGLDQTRDLLSACGEAFMGSSTRDLIVEYCLQYNEGAVHPLTIDNVDALLAEYNEREKNNKKPLEIIGFSKE